ncbi:RNA polymerase sigma factor [Symbiobacterium terraclitae]|uniref:RNA polymerase sigma factor n=1 Tax=Symbiobacterium terraclitae TaxID=557451 RepID=UPI0035B5675D
MADEATLVQQVKAGAEGAFDRLVGPHLARAYRTACLITQQEELARDALQEALVRAYLSLGRFRPGSPFYAWFVRIVVNEAIRQSRRGRREPALPLPEPVDPSGPEARLLALEERRELWAAIGELSADHRTVIVLRYFEEFSEAEMAAVLGVSPGTVKSRLNRARRALEQRLSRTQSPQPAIAPLGAQGGIAHE